MHIFSHFGISEIGLLLEIDGISHNLNTVFFLIVLIQDNDVSYKEWHNRGNKIC